MISKMQAERANYGIDGPKDILLLYSLALLCVSLPFSSRFELLLPFSIKVPALICAVSLFLSSSLMMFTSKMSKIRFANNVIKDLRLKGDEKVLDVGCGRGLYMMTAAKYLNKGKAFGLDIWEKGDQSGNKREATLSNARCEKVLHKVEVVEGDMRKIPFEGNTFDVIIAGMAIHNISSAEGRDQAIREIARVAKDRVVLIDYMFVKKYAAILKELGWSDVTVSSPTFRTFPPYRTLRARKSR